MLPSNVNMLGTTDLVYRHNSQPHPKPSTQPDPSLPLRMSGASLPVKCPVCHTDLAYNSDLESHLSSHGISFPYTCGAELTGRPGTHWGCGRQFESVVDFYHHLQTDWGSGCLQPLTVRTSCVTRQYTVRRKPVIPSIAISQDVSQSATGEYLPLAPEANLATLRPGDHSLTVEPEPNQTVSNFKHRYDSTSRRRSGKSDEGYHSLYGDPDTSREALLADHPLSSYKPDALDSTIPEIEVDVPVQPPEPAP